MRKHFVAAGTLAALTMMGCSSGVMNSGSTAISPNVATTTTQTLVTDAPADQVLALGLTVDSIVLSDASGNGTTVLSTPTPIEVGHLNGVQEPLLPPLKVPQGTYTTATIQVADPVVVYVDPTTKKPVKATATLSAATTVVTFTSPIVVTATSSPIVFDLMVAQSVALSGTTATVTPTFDVRQLTLSKQPTGPGNGMVGGIVGKVASVSGTTLNLTLPNGNMVAISTDANTVLQGFNALSALSAGELVDVDVAQQQSGGLLATRIHVIPAQAEQAFVGPITAVSGSPVTSFTQLVRQQLGGSSSATGTSYAVAITSSTTFELAPQMGSLPSLPFTPAISAATIFPGQNVLVAAASVSGTDVTASSVTLAPQTVDGTVTAVSVSGGLTTYTVALPTGSALASLTGASSVTVFTSTNTQSATTSTIQVGSTVRFNGLLFNVKGALELVAGIACDGPGQPPKQHH